MKKAYIDLTDFDVQRGSLRRFIERAIAFANTQLYSPVVFLARPSHISEVESAVMSRANTNVVSVSSEHEVLSQVQRDMKRATAVVPNDSTDYVYTFSGEVRNTVMGWKAQGSNVYFRPGTDILAFNAPPFGAADTKHSSAARNRNRKYEIAKHKAKKLRVYAEWRARRAIYDEIEVIVKANPGVMLADLKRGAMRQARQAAADKGFDLQPNHFFAANDSVFQVALRVGIFYSEGGRLIGDQDVPYVVSVAEVAPDFRLRCDLHILECIINELGDVTDEHCLSLAHLMYGEGVSADEGGASLDDLEERFSNLMKMFGHRLQRNASGFYWIAPISVEKVQSIAAGR